MKGQIDIESHSNQGFSKEIAEGMIEPVLHQFSLLTSRSHLSLSSRDIDEIGRAEDAVHDMVRLHFELIHERAIARRANLLRYADIDFVSLGEDCLPRTIPTHWGLKPNAKLGELTYPFDLAVHPLSMLPALIESDFAGYLDPASLRFLTDKNFCQNETLRINFNHEKGPVYAANDFQLLIEAYSRRIDNFRKRLCAGGSIVFLIHVRAPAATCNIHLSNLSRVLRMKCKQARFLVICINTWKTGLTVDKSQREVLADEPVEVIDIHYPHENYVWYVPGDAFSPEGHRFEKDEVSSIQDIVDRWADIPRFS